ncbi:MAG: site-2 protease family protein, partial [Ardenticatenaceae bacterium]
MAGAFQIGRLFGVDIRIHFSWLFIFALVAWSLATTFLPDNYPSDEFPNWTTGAYWGIGIAASALLFASVLVHEMAHSLVAISRGHAVHSITLFFLGGVSQIEDEAKDAGEEFVISVVGPLTSLALFGIFLGVFYFASDGSLLEGLTRYLFIANALVAGFNMIPAFPLDGGRVLKALVWRATGSETRAITVSSVTGTLFGYGMIGLGVLAVFTTSLVTGLWFIFIGWFIQSAAGSVRRQEAVESALSGKTVRDAMREEAYPVIPPGTTVQNLVDSYITREFERAYIVQLGDTFGGLVTLNDVKKIPQDKWSQTWVTEAMTRAEQVVTVSPSDNLEQALNLLVQHGFHQLVVMKDGKPEGLLTRGDVLRV